MRESGKKDGKPYVHIGTIGHADHGKTTLSKAIDEYLAAARRQKKEKTDAGRSSGKPE